MCIDSENTEKMMEEYPEIKGEFLQAGKLKKDFENVFEAKPLNYSSLDYLNLRDVC